MKLRISSVCVFFFMLACSTNSAPGDGQDLVEEPQDQIESEDSILVDSSPDVHLVASLVPEEYTGDGPQFWFEAVESELASKRELMILEVRGRNLGSIVGLALAIGFDKDILEPVSIEPLANLGDDGSFAKGVGTLIEPGVISVGVSRFPKEYDPWNPKVEGKEMDQIFILARMTLALKKEGLSTLSVLNARSIIRRSDYSMVSFHGADMDVHVEAQR